MIVTFLQYRKPNFNSGNNGRIIWPNLGTLLEGFLFFYGHEFDYIDKSINCYKNEEESQGYPSYTPVSP